MSRRLVAGLCAGLFFILMAGAQAQTPTHKPGGFHSPDIQPKSFWDLRLPRAGLYYYHCHPHPFMQGEIEVTENAPSGTVQVTIRDFDYQPRHVTVRPNETVHFVNEGPNMHTVDESVPPPSPTASQGNSPALPIVVVLASLALLSFLSRRATDR